MRSTEYPLTLFVARWLIVVFVLGMVGQYIVDFLPSVNRLVGIALAGLYAFVATQERNKIPAEILLFGGFIIWGVLTGMLVAQDTEAVMEYARLLLQLWAMAFAIAGFVALKRDADIALLPLVLAALVLAIYVLSTNQFTIALDPLSRRRVTSFLTNANELGHYAFLGVVASLYFWGGKKPIWFRIILLAIVAILAVTIVYSASRKSFLGMLALIVAWLWFCYRRQVFQRLGTAVLVLMAMAGIYLLSDYALANTNLGTRLMQGAENPVLDDTRYGMYVEGLEFFSENPLTGLGLGNFTFRSVYGTYSHSDYIETLSTTGIVGFALYFLIYLVLWRRLSRLSHIEKSNPDPHVAYRVGLFKAIVLVFLFLAAGRTNFLSVPTWVVLSAIIGYSFALDFAQQKIHSPTRWRSEYGQDLSVEWREMEAPQESAAKVLTEMSFKD